MLLRSTCSHEQTGRGKITHKARKFNVAWEKPQAKELMETRRISSEPRGLLLLVDLLLSLTRNGKHERIYALDVGICCQTRVHRPAMPDERLYRAPESHGEATMPTNIDHVPGTTGRSKRPFVKDPSHATRKPKESKSINKMISYLQGTCVHRLRRNMEKGESKFEQFPNPAWEPNPLAHWPDRYIAASCCSNDDSLWARRI